MDLTHIAHSLSNISDWISGVSVWIMVFCGAFIGTIYFITTSLSSISSNLSTQNLHLSRIADHLGDLSRIVIKLSEIERSLSKTSGMQNNLLVNDIAEVRARLENITTKLN